MVFQQTATQFIFPWILSSMILQFNTISVGHISLKCDIKWSEYSDISESTNVRIQSQYAFKALVASGYLELRIVGVQGTWIQKRLQILSSSPKGKAITSRIPDIYAISLRS